MLHSLQQWSFLDWHEMFRPFRRKKKSKMPSLQIKSKQRKMTLIEFLAQYLFCRWNFSRHQPFFLPNCLLFNNKAWWLNKFGESGFITEVKFEFQDRWKHCSMMRARNLKLNRGSMCIFKKEECAIVRKTQLPKKSFT